MFDILACRLPEDVKPSPSGKTRMVLDNLNADIEAFIAWKGTDVTAVESSNLFVTILTLLADKVGYNLDRTVQDIYTRSLFVTPEICSSLGLGHSNTVARERSFNLQPTFFIVGASPFRASVSAETSYRDITPVRYLSHDSTNVQVVDRPKADTTTGLGFVIIEIDFGLLMLQFTLWLKEQLGSGFDYKRSVPMFAAMHVLPTLKRTQFAIAMMNRITNIAERQPVDDIFRGSTKAFPNRTPAVHGLLAECASWFLRKECTFEYLLGTLPVPEDTTLGKIVALPDIAPTRQVAWLMLMARYNTYRYLYALARVDSERARRFPVAPVVRALVRADNDNSFSQSLNLPQQLVMKAKFDELIARSQA